MNPFRVLPVSELGQEGLAPTEAHSELASRVEVSTVGKRRAARVAGAGDREVTASDGGRVVRPDPCVARDPAPRKRSEGGGDGSLLALLRRGFPGACGGAAHTELWPHECAVDKPMSALDRLEEGDEDAGDLAIPAALAGTDLSPIRPGGLVTGIVERCGSWLRPIPGPRWAARGFHA